MWLISAVITAKRETDTEEVFNSTDPGYTLKYYVTEDYTSTEISNSICKQQIQNTTSCDTVLSSKLTNVFMK